MSTAASPSGRPVRTVLDALRARIDPERFDGVVLALEAVVADLGYGDVRALPGSIAWIDRLHEAGKRVALVDASDRSAAALDLAGVADRFESVAPSLAAALGVEPERVVAVDASAAGIAIAWQAGVHLAIAVARGADGPEQLRRAGADAVVADLLELV